MTRGRSRALPYAALVLQTMLAALNYLVAKRALREVDPIAVAMLRLFGTNACFVPLLLVLGRGKLPPRRLWPRIALVGLLGVPLNQAFFLGGLSRTTATHGVLLYALTPLFVYVIALASRTERPEPTKALGLLLALGGAAIVVLEKTGASLAGGGFHGDLMILAGVAAWSGYTAFGKSLVMELGPVAATGWALLVGMFFFLPIGLGPALHAPLGHLTPGFWWALAYLVVMTSVVSYLCWYYALGKLDPSRVAVFANAQPVVVAIASWAILGERITGMLAAGGALVIAGVVVATHEGVRERLRTAMALAADRAAVRSQE